MKYHFRITKLDDGRFLAQSIEHFYCAVCDDSLSILKTRLYVALHRFLSVPPSDSIFASPLRLTFNEIAEYYSHNSLEVLAVAVKPSTAFALTLRRLRANRGLCQREVAKRLGMRSLSHYQRLEDPRFANPTLDTLDRLQRLHPKFNIAALFEPDDQVDRD
jgi:antitoxin HicB